MGTREVRRDGLLECFWIEHGSVSEHCVRCGSRKPQHSVGGGPAYARFCEFCCPVCCPDKPLEPPTEEQRDQVLFDLVQRGVTQWQGPISDQYVALLLLSRP